jgi:dynein heavy chain
MQKQVTDRGLQVHPSWMSKCVQLYETYQVRHGIMVVGPTGSGKSTIMDVLAGALTDLGQKHVIWRMNPKSITAPQMFGRLDAATGDWTDGIFAVLWRRAARARNQHTWIVLDGPVDAIWIENLNTVLDDNKVLTLANGDRVQMSATMKAMFEPENLNNASPATVSRAGIIYVSDSELGWKPLVASWLAVCGKEDVQALSPCFEKFVGPLLDCVRLECKPVMQGAPWPHVSRDFCQVTSLLTLLKAAISKKEPGMTDPPQLEERHLERIFVYCAAWALGGMLVPEDRTRFDAKLRTLAAAGLLPKMKADETIYDFFVDDAGEWGNWQERVPAWQYPVGVESPKYASLVIPTVDSVRYEHLLGMVASVGKATLLVGGPGTAKTTIVSQYIAKLNTDQYTSKSITFSSLTTPNIFQMSIEGVVEKRQGRTYGPPAGKQMAVFIDDISMPAYNDWGDQVTNEAVRQLLETGGLYQLEKPIGDQKFITDCLYIAAMNTPGGGKNDIPNRLKRHFACFNVPLPSAASIRSVFGTLVAGRFDAATFSEPLVAAAAKLVPATVALWNRVQAKMLPTPAKFHYLFNMRELSKVFQGVILASRDRFRKDVEVPPYSGDITSSEGYLVALWRHECERVFCDKLTNMSDKTWTEDVIMELIKENFGAEITQQVTRRVCFVDFLREPTLDPETGEIIAPAERCYEAIDLEALRTVVDAKQKAHNEQSRGQKFELVLFDAALEHLCRISRLLASDRGSALLVGVGGSGKQSLTRLAAYLAGATPFQITITKQYNQQALFDDIKIMYKLAGFKGQKVAFIFTDAEIKEEGFLEYINQILMTGAVAGLFPRDELDAIVSDIRPIMKRESPELVDTYDNLYNFFMVRLCCSAARAHALPLTPLLLCCAGPRARQPARVPLLLARRPQVLAPLLAVPGPHQRLHRGLVPALARGRAHRRGGQVRVRLRDGVPRRGQDVARAAHGHGAPVRHLRVHRVL